MQTALELLIIPKKKKYSDNLQKEPQMNGVARGNLKSEEQDFLQARKLQIQLRSHSDKSKLLYRVQKDAFIKAARNPNAD